MLKLVIGLGLITLIVNTRPLTQEQLIEKQGKLIEYYAKKHKIQLNLAKALVKVESNFNPNATSNKNAKGLTQVVYKWHYKRCNLVKESQLFNPSTNLDCGLSYLRQLYLSSGSISDALAKYNAGTYGHRTKAGQQYARLVLSTMEQKI